MSALVCLTYDDALPVHCEVVAPLLAERGLRGTFYIPAARDDLHEHLADWRRVAEMGHELGNHSCFHPCRTRADWDWKPPYRLEAYTRARLHDELQLANRILQLVDGRSQRSYGATCSDLTCGPGQGRSFVEDIQDLFSVVRSGGSERPLSGNMPFISPALWIDHRRADDIISVLSSMHESTDAWIILGMHGVGTGTHHNFIEMKEHQLLIDWIAAQSEWLKAATISDAAALRSCGL